MICWSDASKEFVIPFFPYAPGCLQEDFHEHGLIPIIRGFAYPLQSGSRYIPRDSNFGPAVFAKWALKDHVLHILFN